MDCRASEERELVRFHLQFHIICVISTCKLLLLPAVSMNAKV
jgi:hypothetical protein